jgi:hypothetical protein
MSHRTVLTVTMLAALFAGCATAPRQDNEAMSAAQLHALVFGAQQPKSLDDLDGRKISVRGKVDLRYGGQQVLLAEGGQGSCVQLIVPMAIDHSIAARRFLAHVEGALIVMPTPAEDELYTRYKVDGIQVYPACDGRTMVFLKVAKLTKG